MVTLNLNCIKQVAGDHILIDLVKYYTNFEPLAKAGHILVKYNPKHVPLARARARYILFDTVNYDLNFVNDCMLYHCMTV
jgi:hypothetical protein